MVYPDLGNAMNLVSDAGRVRIEPARVLKFKKNSAENLVKNLREPDLVSHKGST